MKNIVLCTLVSIVALASVARAEQQALTPQTAVFPTLQYQTEAPSMPGAYISDISTGRPVTGYPCFTCVAPGAIGLPQAQVVFRASSAYVTSVQIQDISFTGNLTVHLVLIQNQQVILSQVATFFGLVGNEQGVAYFPGTLPSTTGAAQLNISILSGSTIIGNATSQIVIN